MSAEEINPINDLVKFLNAGWKIELIPVTKIGGYVTATIKLTPPRSTDPYTPAHVHHELSDALHAYLFDGSFDIFVEGDFARVLHELRLRFNPRPNV